MKRKDLTGQRFGMLTVIEVSSITPPKGGIVYWTCRCDCGALKDVRSGNLKAGGTSSCGCYARALSSERARNLFTKEPQKCSVPGCHDTTAKGGKGLCGKHYMRFKRHGDVNYITPEDIAALRLRNAQPNLGKVKPQTYKKFMGKHEHRVIAEIKIGRKLTSDEVVHHINGNRSDNSLDNLEVMKRAEHSRLHRQRQGVSC